MVDVCLTLKNDEENKFYARLAKSMVLALEEVPLPLLLFIIWCPILSPSPPLRQEGGLSDRTHEPRMSLAQPCLIASCIKLVALVWGIVKFAKLKFCWSNLSFILPFPALSPSL